MDLRQDPEPNMHVYWEGNKNGPESVITDKGGWLKTHGGRKLVTPPRTHRKALREVVESVVGRCKRIARTGEALGIVGDIVSLIERIEVDADRQLRATEKGISYDQQLRIDNPEGVVLTPFGVLPLEAFGAPGPI
jgi:hypothetical protein